MVLENNLFLENYFHQTDENGKILVVCSLVGSLLVMPVMYFKTDKKIKDIQNSEISESYCVISIQMLIVMKISYVSLFFANICFALLIVLNVDGGKPFTHKFSRLISFLPKTLGIINMYIQSLEWLTMIYIIIYQKNQKMSEIMYKLNNSNEYKNFQKRETTFKNVFLGTILTIYLSIWVYNAL